MGTSTATTEVSFVVPCFKSRRTIGRTLDSILAQGAEIGFEVVVVDSSQDSTSQWIEENFPTVQVVSSSERLSPGAARNLGVKKTKGRFLAFLDADTEAAPDWLETLLSRIAAPGVRVVGGTVEIGNPESLAARILHWIEFSEFLVGTPSGLRQYLSSSNLLLKKREFLEAGGFDERFVMAEDLLLSRSFPGSLFLEGTASVAHYYRSTWKEVVSHLSRLGYWSGRFRSSVETKSSWLKFIPLASLGLAPVRTILIVRRLWRNQLSLGLYSLIHSPLIMTALLYWALGFRRGLKERPELDRLKH